MNPTCPEQNTLSALLHGEMRDDEQVGVVKHLDTCERCQVTLEQLAAGDTPLEQAILRQGVSPQPIHQPTSDSAYWPAVAQLRHEVAVEQQHRAVVSQRRHDSDVAETQSETSGQDTSVEDEAALFDFLDPPKSPGSIGRLDHFDVIEEVGRGGMGVVLKAFDTCLHRYVAIKILTPQTASGPNARPRFIREVRAAAAIRHEHVVSIYYVDEIRGRLYLVMEFVPGQSLEQRLSAQGPLELKEILQISSQLSRGLAAAHSQGLVHRDVKPANILLDGDKIKITDFGLARASEDGRLTQTGMVVGTPQYMAPEQAQGHAVDHRADLFSLGSVLYAMSTGQAPFGASSTMGTLLSVVKDTPRPVRDLNPQVPEWMATIIAKLHAKNPAERYQSADEVAELLGQHFCHLKLPDRVPMPANQSPAKTWAGTMAGLLGGMFGRGPATRSSSTTMTPVEETIAPPRATFDAGTGPIWATAFSADDALLAMALDDGTVKLWDVAARRVRATLNVHRGPVWAVQFSKVGNLMATASDDGAVKLWDATTFKELCALKQNSPVRTIAFSPDAKRLATGGRDGSVQVWDIATCEPIANMAGHGSTTTTVAFSADGQIVASGSGDKSVRLWHADSGQEQLMLSGHSGGVYATALSPDNRRVATGGWDKSVMLWDAASGVRLNTLQGHTQDVWSLAFSPSGRLIASGSEDRTVRVWDAATGQTVATHRGHTGTIYSVAFSHDGRTIASGGRDGTVKLWDAGE